MKYKFKVFFDEDENIEKLIRNDDAIFTFSKIIFDNNRTIIKLFESELIDEQQKYIVKYFKVSDTNNFLINLIIPESSSDEKITKRFEKEKNIIKMLFYSTKKTNPISTIIPSYYNSKQKIIIQDYKEQTLQTFLQSENSEYDYNDILHILNQIYEVVEWLLSNKLYYTDLKLQNFLIESQNKKIYLIDLESIIYFNDKKEEKKIIKTQKYFCIKKKKMYNEEDVIQHVYLSLSILKSKILFEYHKKANNNKLDLRQLMYDNSDHLLKFSSVKISKK